MDPGEKRTLFNKLYQRYKRLKQSNQQEQETFTPGTSLDVVESLAENRKDAPFLIYNKTLPLDEGQQEATCSRASSDGTSGYIYGVDTATDDSSDEISEKHDFVENASHINLGNEPSMCYEQQIKQYSSVTEEKSFIGQLSDWAITYNINHNALSGLLHILRQNKMDVPKDARTLLKTPRNTGTLIEVIEGGFYYHFGLKQSLQNLINHSISSILDNVLKICVNVDGLPLSKSSGSQLWPIMVNLFGNKNNVDICGLFHGNEKPKNANEFLRKFVDEATDLINTGLVYNGKNYSVNIVAFICDVPAKAFIKCTRGHSGYMSCTKCDTEGIFKGNRICFPALDGFRMRTDASFRQKEQESHHIDTSVLEQIPNVDMISSFPLDYMHLICLGVVKKLVNNLWLSGKPPFRLSGQQAKDISQVHLSLHNQVPHEFSRKPRSLLDIKRWKATELRLFLFYTGPVVLKRMVSTDIYQNFISLHIALSLLSKNQYVDYAGQLLKYFIETFSILYGEENISHNVHNLLHLADDVKVFGSIKNFSAFPFENHMLFLKRILRKGDQPLQQIVNRINEFKQSYLPDQQKVNLPVLKYEHLNGPLVENHIEIKQFKKVFLENFELSLDEANNCCLLDDDSVVDIKNIVSLNSVIKVIVQKYFCLENFYNLPCESSKLGIFLVSKKGPIESRCLSQVVQKFVKLKIDNNIVVFPLLHTTR